VNTKAGVNFKVNKDLLLYATFGQGFRDGGSNPGLGASCYANGAPQKFTPDTLNNFEVGWKSTMLNGRMTWNGALYYMPWKNYQAPVFDLAICPIGFNANLGNARIYGAESNLDYTIVDGLTVQLSASYNDSHLITNTFFNPGFYRDSGREAALRPVLQLQRECALREEPECALKGYLQYDIAHKGDMWSDLRAVDPHGFERSLQPAYDISNLRFGIDSASERWGRKPTSLISSTRMRSSSPTRATTTTARRPTSRGCLVFA
jgi:iron complex outermembrane receptor protein